MHEREKKVFSTHGIGNFKAFKNLEEIEIAPITLIYGQNSGGKSTFLQSLLALSQSSESLIKNKFIFSGKEIDAGTFESIKNKNSKNKSEISVKTSSIKEEYRVGNAIRLNCFKPILEARNNIYISKSDDPSYGLINKIEIIFNGYLSDLTLKFNKILSFKNSDFEDSYLDGRIESQSRYDLDTNSYNNLSEIIKKVISEAKNELDKIKLDLDFENKNNDKYIEIDLGFNRRDPRINLGLRNELKQKNHIVYKQVINLLKYAASLSGGWIESNLGVIRFFPFKFNNDKKSKEYINLLKDFSNDLINVFTKKIHEEKYIFTFLIKKKDDFILENSNPEKESIVLKYNSIETDFKIINQNNEIIFWDQIQNNIQKLCNLQHANRIKKFNYQDNQLSPIVDQIREISIVISDLRQKIFSLTFPKQRTRNFSDHKATEKISKVLKKANFQKYFDQLKIFEDKLYKLFLRLDKNYNQYSLYNPISDGFNIIYQSIKKIIFFADNYESMLPGNEEYEAFVENRTIGIHLDILEIALMRVYIKSINYLRSSQIDNIFKPTLDKDYNSKLFVASFLFLSNIRDSFIYRDDKSIFVDTGNRLVNQINVNEDFFSLNKNKINFTSRSVIDSYEGFYTKETISEYIKYGQIPTENIEFLPFPFFKKNLIAKELTEETVHLGPARPAAKRFYTSKDIENASFDDAAILLKEKSELKVRLNLLISILRSMNILDRIRISPSIDKSIVAKKIEVKPIGSKSFVNLADTGFGVSQILPIIINSIFRKDQTIIIQQPETHLHPRLQAEIGSLLSDSIAKKNMRRRYFAKKTWIVETHSEIILLRLLKLIRKGELNSNNLRVYYFDVNDKEGSQITRMHISKEGELITQWPEGFFSNEIDEVFDI